MLSRYNHNSHISSKHSKHTKCLQNKILKQTCLKWIDVCTNYYRLKSKHNKQDEIYSEAYNKWRTIHDCQTTLLEFKVEIDKYLNNY
jgi:hypothetical protein